MATHLVSHLFLAFSLFLISANGRSLQKNYTSEKIHLPHSFSSNNIRVKAVSHATSSYTGQTNYNDVQGLATLCTSYPWLSEDNDDPCLPPKWTWIECNSDAKPRILALDLSSRILVGQLPDFSSMDALQRIDLSSNDLYGSIPSFLGTFPHLQELDLAFNFFTGLVPDSLACNKNLTLSLTGNTDLAISNSCSTSNTPSPPANRNTGGGGGGSVGIGGGGGVGSDGVGGGVGSGVGSNGVGGSSFRTPPPRAGKSSKLPVILGSTIPSFIASWVAAGIYAIRRHKSKAAAAIAGASAPGPNNPHAHTAPMEEIPMNARHNDMSP